MGTKKLVLSLEKTFMIYKIETAYILSKPTGDLGAMIYIVVLKCYFVAWFYL